MSSKGTGKAKGGKRGVKKSKAQRSTIELILNTATLKKLGFRAGVGRGGGSVALLAELRPVVAEIIRSLAFSLLATVSAGKKQTISVAHVEAALKSRGIPVAAHGIEIQHSKKKAKKEASAEGEKKTRHVSGASERAIKFYQKGSGLILRKKSPGVLLRQEIDSLAKQLGLEYVKPGETAPKPYHFSRLALEILQLHLENYLVKLLRAAHVFAVSAHRQGLKPQDVRNVLKIQEMNILS